MVRSICQNTRAPALFTCGAALLAVTAVALAILGATTHGSLGQWMQQNPTWKLHNWQLIGGGGLLLGGLALVLGCRRKEVKIEGVDEIEDSNLKAALLRLQGSGVLGSSAIAQYLNKLKVASGSSCYLRSTGNEPSMPTEDGSFALPVVLKKSWLWKRDHIVLFYRDTAGQWEFYDSNGTTIEEHGDRKLKLYPEFSLLDLKEKLGEELVQNTTRHQGRFDGVSCGVHVMLYTELRQKGWTCQQIKNLDFSKIDLSQIRTHMARRLQDQASELTDYLHIKETV